MSHAVKHVAAGDRRVSRGAHSWTAPTAHCEFAVENRTYLVISGNTFYGDVKGFTSAAYPNNTYLTSKPTANVVKIDPNKYEPGRANVAIYNWENLTTVPVDLSNAVAVGAHYEIRNVYDYYGPALASGTYNGGSVEFPMTDIDVPDPIGWQKPSILPFPEFMAFVVISDGGSPTP